MIFVKPARIKIWLISNRPTNAVMPPEELDMSVLLCERLVTGPSS
jgi:hypothetical protein